MSGLVLSLFSGLGVLDHGFRLEGFCVVSAGDVIRSSLDDIRGFHPPAGIFDGILAGPPCPAHSRLRHQIEQNGYEPEHDLIPELERCIREAEPRWWLMENAPRCYMPDPGPAWGVHSFLINTRSLGMTQNRIRRIAFGLEGDACDLRCSMPGEAFENPHFEHVVTADPRPVPIAIGGSGKRKPGADLPKRSLEDCLELQGLPRNLLDHTAFTNAAKHQLIGNAVPLPLAQALAQAVRKAT